MILTVLRRNGRYFFTNGKLLTISLQKSIMCKVYFVIKVYEPLNELSD